MILATIVFLILTLVFQIALRHEEWLADALSVLRSGTRYGFPPIAG